MNKVLKALETIATRRLTVTFDKIDFTYTHLSGKRLANWALGEAAFVLKRDEAWAYPTHLQVEPTNLCNLRCPVCHTVTDNKPQGMLSLADFQKIMDEVGDYLLLLHFWGWGEPFINKDFFSMIKYAKSKGIKIITSTNGHFFEEESDVDRLLDTGLDVLIFSMDAVDREAYEKYRRRGDFDRAMDGLRRLLRRKEERGAALPLVNMRMVVTRNNEDQVPQMKSLAQELGVDVLTLKTMYSFDNETTGANLIPRDQAYRRFKYDETGQPIRQVNSCKKLWNHPTIYRDGVVVACDYFTGLELPLGNVFADGGFRKVWFGEDFRRLRARFAKRELAGTRCESCALNFAGVDRCISHVFRFAKA
jgi:radical SAM protein with 4Fe4S-binding SPASM domain